MKLIIRPIENTSITFEQYYDFIQDAYKERIEQKLYFVCTRLNSEQLRNDIKSFNGNIFLAMNEVNLEGGGEDFSLYHSIIS